MLMDETVYFKSSIFPKKSGIVVLSSLLFLMLSGCGVISKTEITLTSMKMAKSVDEQLMPVDVVNIFPSGTAKVYCWFSWKNAKKNITLAARWTFVTDDIDILDSSFTIPRKAGTGSVSISMPESKTLPSGEYRVDLMLGKRILRSLAFSVR
jgi:hypothetical protein